MKRGLLIVVLMALIVAVAACGGGAEEPTAAPQAPATEQPAVEPAAGQESADRQEQPAAPTSTPVPPTATPEPATPTPEPEMEGEPLSEEQLSALEALDSYRMVVTYTSQGTDADGNLVDDSAEIVTEYTKDPAARRMVVTFVDNTDPEAEQTSMESFQIGQDMYMFAGEDLGWMRVSVDESPFNDPDLTMLSSGGIFSNLEEMERVRPDEKINGIDSRHYRFDERVLNRLFGAAIDEDLGEVKADGDLWVAKDGGYVTRYELTIEVNGGSGGMLDPTLVNGTIQMLFDLQDVNSDIAIELPEEATAGASLAGFDGPFPAPEGSRVQAASAGFTIIESDLPTEEVLAFYEQALADLGWTRDEEGSMSFGNMASLAFTKDGVKLSLLINADENTGMTQIMANAE